MTTKIAYQGVKGAYSEQACQVAYPNLNPVACDTFTEAMEMVEYEEAKYAMIPLENSTAGRVEEIYRLIPKMNLFVVGEHFQPVVHCLLGDSNLVLLPMAVVAEGVGMGASWGCLSLGMIVSTK